MPLRICKAQLQTAEDGVIVFTDKEIRGVQGPRYVLAINTSTAPFRSLDASDFRQTFVHFDFVAGHSFTGARQAPDAQPSVRPSGTKTRVFLTVEVPVGISILADTTGGADVGHRLNRWRDSAASG